MIKQLLFIGLTFATLSWFTGCKKDPNTKPVPVIAKKDTFVLSVSVSNMAYHGTFTITTNDTAQETIKLYNRWGQQILNQPINGTTTIDVVGLQDGVYVWVLTTRTKIFHGSITFLY